MCGRFVRRSPLQHVVELFSASLVDARLLAPPRYNIAPTQDVLAVRMRDDGQRTLGLLHWGLIPAWADDPAIGNRMINARAETVSQKPAFRQAFRQRRCLLPADGFYEWKPAGKRKQPYLFHRRDNELFAFAGLWDRWQRDEQTIDSCTILTTDANAVVRPVHDRMPLIIAPQAYDTWLDPRATPDDLAPLLRPVPDDLLAADAVSPRVSNPANDDPHCLEPQTPGLF